MTAPTLRDEINLTDAAEVALEREAARVGGYFTDGDAAAACSAARNMIDNCEAILAARQAVRETIIPDRPNCDPQGGTTL